MSLVEKALRKMQSSAAQAAAAAEAAREARPARSEHVPAVEPHRVPKTLHVEFKALLQAGLVPPVPEERQFGEQYRRIKRPLIANAFGPEPLERGQLIMVASALAGEGKTFTSINLALSMAREKDTRVLLVDADLAKRHTSAAFGLVEQPGLLDLLHDPHLNPLSVIVPTDVPGLSLLPAGAHREAATELLASGRMHELARILIAQDPGGIVLFDSSPLLLTTESQALAQIVGQVVVVVKASSTSRSVLLDALNYLHGQPGISLILNQSAAKAPTGYYYYKHADTPGNL
jgi:exopolysaccharide/PEP-CTERM locus tyrosine autokinase